MSLENPYQNINNQKAEEKKPEELKNPESKQEISSIAELSQRPPENLNESTEISKENQEKVENISDRTDKPIEEMSIKKPENPAPENQGEHLAVRKFTKEIPELQEERNKLAQEIRVQRKEYFATKGELGKKSEELRSQMEKKEIDLLEAKENIEALQENLDRSKESYILRLFDFIKLRKLREKIGIKTKLEEETDSISQLISELDQQMADKKTLTESRQSVDRFYKNKTAKWEEFEKEREFRKAKNISEKYDVLFVHGLLHMRGPVENSALKDESISFETKLKVLLGLEPTISSSTVKKGDGIINMWTGTGVFLKNGIVRNAFSADAGTKVKNLYERSINPYVLAVQHSEKKNIYGQVEDAIEFRATKEYNEFILENPQVAGFYVCLKGKNDLEYDFKERKEISDETVVEAARNLSLPIYGLRNGIPCEVRYNEGSKELEYVGNIDRSEILQNTFDLEDRQKKDIIKELVTENSPFKAEIEQAVKNKMTGV